MFHLINLTNKYISDTSITILHGKRKEIGNMYLNEFKFTTSFYKNIEKPVLLIQKKSKNYKRCTYHALNLECIQFMNSIPLNP